MTPSEVLRAQLIDHEGERLVVYDDRTSRPLRLGDTLQGHPTIGVGRNLAGRGITQAESRVLLENDIQACIGDLVTFPWFEQLNEGRQRGVIDLRFNLGPMKFRGFRNLIIALAEGKYERAADHLLQSLWARQVQPTRRDRVEHLLRHGTDGTP